MTDPQGAEAPPVHDIGGVPGTASAATVQLLQKIADEVWAGTRRIDLLPSCCIAATRIAGQVADYFGLSNTPLPVDVLAWNPAAAPYLEQGVPVSDWPPGAHSIGGSGAGEQKRWGGHLVLAVTTPDGRFMLDPSVPQYSRPGRGIVTPPFAAMLPDGWPDNSDVFGLVIDDPPAWITYRPTGNHLYRGSPDWRLWRQRYRGVIGEIIRAVKTG